MMWMEFECEIIAKTPETRQTFWYFFGVDFSGLLNRGTDDKLFSFFFLPKDLNRGLRGRHGWRCLQRVGKSYGGAGF
jgi:hypothetical protein